VFFVWFFGVVWWEWGKKWNDKRTFSHVERVVCFVGFVRGGAPKLYVLGMVGVLWSSLGPNFV